MAPAAVRLQFLPVDAGCAPRLPVPVGAQRRAGQAPPPFPAVLIEVKCLALAVDQPPPPVAQQVELDAGFQRGAAPAHRAAFLPARVASPQPPSAAPRRPPAALPPPGEAPRKLAGSTALPPQHLGVRSQLRAEPPPQRGAGPSDFSAAFPPSLSRHRTPGGGKPDSSRPLQPVWRPPLLSLPLWMAPTCSPSGGVPPVIRCPAPTPQVFRGE